MVVVLDYVPLPMFGTTSSPGRWEVMDELIEVFSAYRTIPEAKRQTEAIKSSPDPQTIAPSQQFGLRELAHRRQLHSLAFLEIFQSTRTSYSTDSFS